MAELKSTGLPSNEYAFKNRIYLSANIYHMLERQAAISASSAMNVKVKHFIIKAEKIDDDSIDDNHFGISGPYREMLGISKMDMVIIEPVHVKKNKLLSHIDFTIDILQVSADKKNEVFDMKESEIEKLLRKQTEDLIFNKHQVFLIKGKDLILKCSVLNIQFVQVGDKKITGGYGFVEAETVMGFKCSLNASKLMKIKSDKLKEKEIFKKDFNFQEMGIGGLDKEFEEIFRRAFNSRRYPQVVLDKYGIKHVKGMLLFGPPGTGKTLIARQIAQALN